MTIFDGGLTIENIEYVSTEILNVLSGKRYTFASHNDGFRPDSPWWLHVRTFQKLENGNNGSPLSVWIDKENRYAGFNILDTHGAWGLSTYLHDSDLEYSQGNGYYAPYIVVKDTEIRVVHRSAIGDLITWVIKVE